MQYKTNVLFGSAVIRPEIIGDVKIVKPTIWQRIRCRIGYLCEFYIPVACVFTMWIALVYFGAWYINNH